MHRLCAKKQAALSRGSKGERGVHGLLSFTATLRQAAPSVFGAAVTTIGSCAPLLACEIQILSKMGEYIVMCTVFSLAIALTMLGVFGTL